MARRRGLSRTALPRADYKPEFMTNWSQFRHRGYKMGSLHMAADEDEKYWTQPGHMLNSLNKRAESYNSSEHKGVHTVDLSKPEEEAEPRPQRNDLLLKTFPRMGQ